MTTGTLPKFETLDEFSPQYVENFPPLRTVYPNEIPSFKVLFALTK